MAGPWFVDPDDGLTTNNGLSTSAPWKLIPGQTGASSQTGYGVVAGDTVNVKNGSTTALQIVPPAANITYRGYGVASNVLSIRLPAANVTKTRDVRVVRDAGSHEGMWTISGCTSSTVIDTSTRSGVTFEDVNIVANGNQTSRVISFASSSQTTSGLTLRRSQISNAPQAAISVYSTGSLIEWCRIVSPVGDGILYGASAANSNKSGTTDTLRYVEFYEPGVGGSVGDALQTIPLSNVYQGALVVSDIYMQKSASIKQAMILSDATGGISVKRFHFVGTPTSHCQIGVETLNGSVTISDGYVYEGGADNALIRFVTSSGTAAATGSTLTIRRVIHDARSSAGLFTAASLSLAGTADGAVVIENCVSKASNTQGLSYSGAVSFHPGSLLTVGANMTCSVKNNILAAGSQPTVRLPTGKANDSGWAVSGNATQGSFTIGSTSYADVAAFEAAHSAATLNLDADPSMAGFVPTSASMFSSGADLGYRRDLRGQQGKKFIGAYAAAKLRDA